MGKSYFLPIIFLEFPKGQSMEQDKKHVRWVLGYFMLCGLMLESHWIPATGYCIVTS